jgi:hypothetical protein
MKEFILPEKWCIKNTDLCIFDKINKIGFNSIYSGNSINKYYFIIDEKIDCENHAPEGYIEITFEQFERYVLNKNESTNNKDDYSYLIKLLKQIK